MEVHPDPDSAKCDGPNMVPLGRMREVLRQTAEIDRIVKSRIGFASLDWAGVLDMNLRTNAKKRSSLTKRC
jgi:2-dehydro-3-deoxyphosphooctonate aldolase (KDO 8-P synthase)